MNRAQIDYLAYTATKSVRTIHGKTIDPTFAYSVIENFLNAYKERTRHSYTGTIELADLVKGLNAAFTMGHPERFIGDLEYKKYFEKKTREEAEQVTFAQVIAHLVSIAIGERFGI